MGALCSSAHPAGSKEEQEINEQISKQLASEKKKRSNEIRLLLLGAGESGKSTIAKQMKILHMQGFTDEERNSFKQVIHNNTYQAVKVLVQASEDLEVPIKNSKVKEMIPLIAEPFIDKITPKLAEAMEALWNDKSIQAVYERRNEFQIFDSAKFFLDDIARISSDKFVPTDQDILRSRIQTTGVIETTFEVESTKFILVDVGGQRSERKKWMHCFEDVTAVLFIVGISEFDQKLYEDNKTNRMHEALKLFHEVCKSKWFTNTAMILFLNKSDIFKAKLDAGKSIKNAFEDYNGADSYDASIDFLKTKFTDVIDPATNKPKEVYPHVTCATDTGQVRAVFESVKDYLLKQALARAGLE